MNKTLLLCSLPLLATFPLFALDQPRHSPFDARIRTIAYNAQDVVQLDCVIGIATHIRLEDGEKYLIHAFGDSQAYAFAVEQNHLFLKPKAENADTNLVVVTDRRSYHFRLTFRTTPLNTTTVYQLAFHYPDTQLKQNQAAAEKDKRDQAFRHPAAFYNLEYTMSGDTDIAPVNVWDNDTFTFFKFPPHRDLPVLYQVDEDGQESLVNRHVSKENRSLLIIHKIHPKWMLRLGDRVLAVYNEATADQGVDNASGTVSPQIHRQIKKAL